MTVRRANRFPIMLVRVIGTCGLIMAIGGCQTMASGATDKAYCSAFKPLRWSGKDTLQTQEQATAHNSVGRALCGWKG